MSTPATPRSKTAYAPTTPSTSRVGSSHLTQASPHYTTTRRHSLYGVEDRVVIDPGSRIWKVGFSGEGKPRDVFYATGKKEENLWKLERARDSVARAEEDKMLEIRLQAAIRSVFHDSLLTDPKARKVILVESPLLPLYIKDMMARILFENQVRIPSVSFAPSHLLALMAVGRITGLVMDCGHLESVALPIFAARPLYPQIQTTPLAGSRLTSHLRALLLTFATYLPPPTSLSAAVSVPAANRATQVPPEVLTDAVVEEIKTRCCFVGEPLRDDQMPEEDEPPSEPPSSDMDVDMDTDPPSEADSSQQEGEEGEMSLDEFSAVKSKPEPEVRADGNLRTLEKIYKKNSTATDLQMRVEPPPEQQVGTGLGTLLIPGWIRERAAEVLFEGDDVDECNLAEVLLDTLLKIPVDLRKTLASSLLITGGMAMIPGFIPRLHTEIIRILTSPPPPPFQSKRKGRPPLPRFDKYAQLRQLVPFFAVINSPNPPPTKSERARVNAGKAPAFAPAMLAWIGGSLAGSLKTGGTEVAREKWDEAVEEDDMEDEDDVRMVPPGQHTSPHSKKILPDWTRSPMRPAAPHTARAAR
ncbi:actin family [Coprinopsis sp. MPI-PUGE-AT-0042]|nr:actin family [Coprinopsis sp. MPI-PUGE-AT-0042]